MASEASIHSEASSASAIARWPNIGTAPTAPDQGHSHQHHPYHHQEEWREVGRCSEMLRVGDDCIAHVGLAL